jgi:hypothetical protein
MGFLGKAKEQAKERAATLGGQAMQLSSGVVADGVDKLTELLDTFNAALPVIRSAGWALEEVTLLLGLPPQVVAKFKTVEERSDAELDELLAQNAERKLAVIVVKSLRQARQLCKRVHVGDLTTQGIAIGLGLIPSIELKLA